MPDIHFYSIDSEDNFLPNVLVKIYSIDGTVLHDYGNTDVAEGKLTIDLSAGEYWIRAYKSEYAFNKRLKLTVSSEESINLIGTNTVDYTPSAAPELCRVSGLTFGASGEPSSGGSIVFVLPEDEYRVNQSGILTSAVARSNSDDFGRLEIDLFRNATYECRFKSRNDYSFLVTVPDLPVCKLSDLLFPIGSEINCSSSATGTVGQELKIPITYSLSLGRTITKDETMDSFFEVEGQASLNTEFLIVDTTASGSYEIKIFGIHKTASMLGSAKKLLKTVSVTVND